MTDKTSIKIDFVDFWESLDKRNNYFYNLLSEKYDVIIDDNPDILFFSVFGQEHLNYKCTKVFYTGENERPDFLLCDFAFSFDHLKNRRNYRLPHYALYGEMKELINRKVDVQAVIKKKQKFCCFVVSNDACKERNEFFHALSKYKKVDSGGRYLNNVGGPVADKMAFIKDYKFVISFENFSFPGYTTEKIYEPLSQNSIPIYWGNPMISQDFNPKAFINCHDYPSFDAVIEHIIELDNNDEAYARYLAAPAFNNDELNSFLIKENVAEQLDKVVAFHFNNKLKLRARLQKPVMFLRSKIWYRITFKLRQLKKRIKE